MSATLTWASSGNATKTNTTVGALFDDLDTLISSKSGDATFSWQKAGKNSAATPFWILLSRKDGSVGRILIVCWTSAPAANNAAILDTAPTTNQVFIAYFPAGNANTASNLTAASGTISGDDTNAVKVSPSAPFSSLYTTSFQAFYLDSYEGILFAFANPAGATTYLMGAGNLAVDASDVVYACTFGTGANSLSNWATSGSNPFPWVAAVPSAGSAVASIRCNYGSNNKIYFSAWSPAGPWANQSVGSSDILTDTSVTKAWFVPAQLVGQTKGEGFVIKFRQFGFGPGTTGAFAVYNTTGPVVAARQICNVTTGGVGFPWATNFKI